MNEKIKNFTAKLGTLWGKWTGVQKGIIIGVAVLSLVLIVVLMRWSSKPTSVPVLDMAITDVDTRDRILLRLNEENVTPTVSSDGIISVSDEQTARRMRSILIREDLIPQNTSPWAIFDVERWTRTDFERKIDVRRAVIEEVKRHIKSLEDIDDASVVVNMPEKAVFASEQDPVTASIIIYPTPGSDILTQRKKVEGIQKILKLAVPGLLDENITIADNTGNILNDFEGLKDFDRLTMIEKQQKLIGKLEKEYAAQILAALQKIYGTDRVRDLNIKIDMDMSERSANTTKLLPTVIKEDNQETPYDDSEVVKSITVSSENANTIYEGTGINPEGPAGVDGNTPPSYKDAKNIVGRSTQTISKLNELVSSSQISEIFHPEIGRRTVSVNIDGSWQKKKDEKGNFIITNGRIEREYIEIPDADLKQVAKLVQDAIGFKISRKDSVTVSNIKIDRTNQFELEDNEYFKALQRQKIILISLAGVALVLLIFILYRIISRELERRKRLREEELIRQAQLERERQLYEAQLANADVSMTVEERKRLELQENAINIAREHPEDVALLIRTWLMEE
ncbi:flagellar basal-body MS-ring/collar protein FliF [Treponema pedis]|uniref:flagellar basal-body MS-ring/collar protein FliF n=1 Tax=Treponema pedis TaxID=409322 RepID=UPI0004142724|nr:flagellar basal-body MS-ring/collar protein FliF [Treponema pedis]QSI05256.1 flagellar basal body M-ring protein FliF [Treponema pedis]